MLPIRHFLLAVLGVTLLGVVNVRAAPPAAQRPPDREYLANIQEAVRQLVHDMEYLQEDIVAELSGHKERTLYRQTDTVLAELVHFQDTLKPGASREQLTKDFSPVDEKVHTLLKAIQELGTSARALRHAVARVSTSDEQLHYAISEGDAAEGRQGPRIERQARALAAAAQELERTAQYALADAPGQGAALIANLHKLAEEANRFQKSQASGASMEQLQRDFVGVNRAWEQVVRGLQLLPPRENVFLLRGAARIDRYHDHLYRLLNVTGDRPQLILRS